MRPTEDSQLLLLFLTFAIRSFCVTIGEVGHQPEELQIIPTTHYHFHFTGDFSEFSRQFPALAKAFENAGAEPNPAGGANDAHTPGGNGAAEAPPFPVLEKTRQQGLSMFENAAKQQGLALRAASETDVFDCVVIGNRERPVVISASTEPRVLLREKWSGIPDLVIALVWLAQNCIIMAEYK